ncbi:MAG: tRNA (adenosine(37)-N6)-threonylcarbamoyltransferase complex transferase subunit TsaD [Candidatus Kerfeldbacteria bacterium RIFCSPHIGHO2_02_FULL_42_14]|uniref:tRNA N6-adenosine threonylcarbamoyltransferase n=1 Tax=Candidatus Kerfeldbacteria bacterium RIFCSPHIGHO2_02_FULL_42_14 TaxID=1798540 RepID=A0A1G2AT25_9BACT|nr:MAG: tRNA (adenosine(37)-N6)-threonylcarbamoyltransferase complex transferase subunit TsaD [Candidatus Kerfeldbacteria bacterium RIFCSPHIGHO2_02_FULL_42_14]OGY83194.1 MAG: tRNA (adenosine(37)-N6)-threonylcarbamoyltransferase complex transferase subunit TsaD [Candidatus Kerfeldbacteria bacterium RIFCSPLOWO2_02_FULL_42_19]OGY86253.1 MAG: tRNA (adenosine(37)-N6)-threonylcarbamoyltransferase complex transferase subunit TsaD [Candidatus Kerfeldbacteria bacterium RIFCSPLOWO2_12_FULL_43_9]
MYHILALETSCDETAASIVAFTKETFVNGMPRCIHILGQSVQSQIALHQKTQGVVPEVAARQHVPAVLPCIDRVLRHGSKCMEDIDAIAVTAGPGLITSLMVGVETAKTIAFVFKKPLLAMNHIESHIAATFTSGKHIRFPALALVVSGGHTELILIPRVGVYTLVGRTRDDAVGEAFDKVAKILHLEYPGGPAIAKCARSVHSRPSSSVRFPRPMIEDQSFDMSFAGLKTAVRYYVAQHPPRSIHERAVICNAFQDAVVELLVTKTLRAVREVKAQTVLLVGGVAANQKLRAVLRRHSQKIGIPFFVPPKHLCTDNATMVALAAIHHFLVGNFSDPLQLTVRADWELSH